MNNSASSHLDRSSNTATTRTPSATQVYGYSNNSYRPGTTSGTNPIGVSHPGAGGGGQQAQWLADNSDIISPFERSQQMQSSDGDASSSSLYFSRPDVRPKLSSRVGNFNYSCPEIVIGSGYDHTADWWAVAVLCFHFLAGITPFEAKTQEETMENIVTCRAAWELLPGGNGVGGMTGGSSSNSGSVGGPGNGNSTTTDEHIPGGK